ncbi:response regulator transcription factor [Alicyclobacillus fodiniaquatilis]|uniref:Response regulator transcription factor n=1 Tax=Alicyclobacillus fodiniaquatilis TaxID=1661150 RepID=A0ABW4JHZ1_9BACL
MRVLLIEDDVPLRDAIVKILAEASYVVDEVGNGEEALIAAETGVYDVLIVDIMLPGLDGIQIAKSLRGQHMDVPILFLTAKDSVESRVIGLNAGGDDYLVKPFAIEELLARVRALLRRKRQVSQEMVLTYGPIRLQTASHDSFIDDCPLDLTENEYRLLEYLVLNKGRILTREQILNRVWGIDAEANAAVVDLYIHYLRKKLLASGIDKHIRTVRGVGYSLRGD